MRGRHVDLAGALLPAVLASLTTWVSLWAWAGFVESPSGYLVPSLFAALLVAVTGAVLRLTGLPSLVVLAGQVVALGVWITHRWAPETAVGGWLPTGSSPQRLPDVLGDAVAAAQSYAAPVGDSVPQIMPLLVVAGAATMLLVDFLACGLRRVPLAGLPLLALYTAPVSILAEGVSWWIFAATATGFLSMLAHEEGQRLSHWGRQVSRSAVEDTGDGGVRTASVRAAARRIGATATGLAVVAPLVIPTLGGGLLPGSGPGGDGDGDVSITNPMVSLRRDLVRGSDIDLVTVRTTDGDPSYLRLSVLDEFTGLTWKPSDRDIPPEQRADGLVARPPGLRARVARRQVDFEISVSERFSSTWLPTPYPVSSIEAPGDWRYDAATLDFVSAVKGQSSAGMDYSLAALEVAATADDLVSADPTPEDIFTPYTDLPDGMPGMVADLAREVTAGLETPYEKAARLQRFFRRDGDFEYSLDRPSGNGAQDLQSFLSTGPDGRIGYCEQFAAAMAVMGRTLGIPSRVAVGFLTPDEVGPGEYVYSAHDLHAWPEMYFEGAGWLRFEPTPSARAPQVPGYSTGRITTPQPTDIPTAAAPSVDPEQVRRDQQQLDAGAAGSGGDDSGGRARWLALAIALVVLALPFAPRVARSLLRRRRWAGARSAAEAAEAGWRELRDTALDLRMRWDEAVTLRTSARALAAGFGKPGTGEREGHLQGTERGVQADPEAAAALERVVRDLELARFARESRLEAGRSPDDVMADVERVSAALRQGASRRARRFASWLPASLYKNAATRVLSRTVRRDNAAVVEPGMDRAV